jgi:hypothetical protein
MHWPLAADQVCVPGVSRQAEQTVLSSSDTAAAE